MGQFILMCDDGESWRDVVIYDEEDVETYAQYAARGYEFEDVPEQSNECEACSA